MLAIYFKYFLNNFKSKKKTLFVIAHVAKMKSHLPKIYNYHVKVTFPTFFLVGILSRGAV